MRTVGEHSTWHKYIDKNSVKPITFSRQAGCQIDAAIALLPISLISFESTCARPSFSKVS